MKQLQLLDINLPESISLYSFSALSWFLIASPFIIALLVSYWYFFIYKKSKKYLIFKQVFLQLDELMATKELTNHIIAQRVDTLLKRVVISFLVKQSLNKLVNNEIWFESLNNLVKKNQLDEFSKKIFLRAPYQPSYNFDRDKYLIQIRAYLQSLKRCIEKSELKK